MFGDNILDVYAFGGSGLPRFTPKAIHRIVVARLTDGKLWSADVPGDGVPDANRFVVGLLPLGRVPIDDASTAAVAKYTADGQRRKVVDVALDFNWQLRQTQCEGDCCIGGMAYHSKVSRGDVSWKNTQRTR